MRTPHVNQFERLERLRSLGRILDNRFEGPLGFRYGLDGLLGLIPVIGDLTTSALSFYIILQAAALGCPPSTLMRMALNVILENLLDLVPFVGNVFDFFWKSNLRNLALLDSHLSAPRKVTWQSRVTLFFVSMLLLLVLVGTGYVTLQTLSAVWNWVVANV